MHNPETGETNPRYRHGHGHLIAKGLDRAFGSGYRTILAYTDANHMNRMNYYSNPSVYLPQTGQPTGIVGLADNARVIRENRFAMAEVGDESSDCPLMKDDRGN